MYGDIATAVIVLVQFNECSGSMTYRNPKEADWLRYAKETYEDYLPEIKKLKFYKLC